MSALTNFLLGLALQWFGERAVIRLINEIRFWVNTVASKEFREKADGDYFKMVTDWDKYKEDRQ